VCSSDLISRFSLTTTRGMAVSLTTTRGMAVSAKSLKLRLKTVSNIKRITSTMKMVAASKLRGFQSRMEAARPMGAAVNLTFDSVPPLTEAEAAIAAATHDGAAAGAVAQKAKPLLIGISSDRGLCGAINSSVVKVMRRLAHEHNDQVQIVVVGDKARTAMGRTHSKAFQFSVNDVFKKPPTFLSASLLAEEILKLDFSKSILIYNQFKSAIAYDTVEKHALSASEEMAQLPRVGQVFEFEGEDSRIMADLVQFRLAVSVFSALLENATCEQSARMSAMDGASKNCGEMISKLTTQMNRARQASITTELCEIVAGAEAISG